MVLNLYFGEAKVSEIASLVNEAAQEFEALGLPHDDLRISSNRAGLHFLNHVLFRDDSGGIDAAIQRAEQHGWTRAKE
jgi:hypothetical protein